MAEDMIKRKNALLKIQSKDPKFRLNEISENLERSLIRGEILNWALKNIDYNFDDIRKCDVFIDEFQNWFKSMIASHFSKGDGPLQFYNRGTMMKVISDQQYVTSVLGKELTNALIQCKDVDVRIQKKYGFPGINIEVSDDDNEEEVENKIKNIIHEPARLHNPKVKSLFDEKKLDPDEEEMIDGIEDDEEEVVVKKNKKENKASGSKKAKLELKNIDKKRRNIVDDD